jgi:N-acetyl-gamma-glutamyl-phosphate reductase
VFPLSLSGHVDDRGARVFDVAVVGGSGYTGGELIRLLLTHPGVRLRHVASRRLAGTPLSHSFPWLDGVSDLSFCAPEDVLANTDLGLVFTAMGHMESIDMVDSLLRGGLRVVDLSADFRLKDASLYETWYGGIHGRPELLDAAVYGLPELNRRAIAASRLCANPGCYATAVALGLLPLASRGLLGGSVVVDAKSGISGAGRVPKDGTVFPEVNEGHRAYAVARHRHLPEMEQTLVAAGQGARILFVPHLLPANRGILASIYIPSAVGLAEARSIFREHYAGEPFVKVCPDGQVPGVQDVRGSNLCRIGIERDERSGHLIVFSTIDNLVKGASGQAVQNMNLMLGLPEEAGLFHLALAP